MANAHFGMIGLGTMGRNFLLNVAESGVPSAGYDLDESKRNLLLKEGIGMPVSAAPSIKDFIAALARPRNIMLLVPAGPIVDSVINELIPLLDAGDLIIDGGNSHYSDTERREKLLSGSGLEFMGVGVSGGEEGARHGASIMPGGRAEIYDRVAGVFEAVAAKVNGEPCVELMGSGSAGHFVKMVHNGIEYGLMQLLAEAYDFMHRVLGLDHMQMSEIFARWNDGELNSFLVEVTADVLNRTDAETGRPLVEVVLDKAAQKGTGKWTSQAAMDLGVPIPTIDAAVAMRQISAQKEVRVSVADRFGQAVFTRHAERAAGSEVHSVVQRDLKAELARGDVETVASELQKSDLEDGGTPTGIGEVHNAPAAVSRQVESVSIEDLKKSLLCSFAIVYAQGMSLLQIASVEKSYGLDLADIAKIWRGGCIIRSAMLEPIRLAYTANPKLPSLLLDESIADLLETNLAVWRRTVARFAEGELPMLCFNSAFDYFRAFRSARLPANLIQAQRDYFGAHTYQRIDKEGVFHTPDW